MKKLVFEKGMLGSLITFLHIINFEKSNKLSRIRTRLKKQLITELNVFEEERLELAKKYARKDDNGEPIEEKNQEGVNFYLTDNKFVKELKDEFDELIKERVSIEVGDYSSKVTPLFEHMEKDDFTIPNGFEGENGDAYDALMTAWEAIQEEVNRTEATE